MPAPPNGRNGQFLNNVNSLLDGASANRRGIDLGHLISGAGAVSA
jgi:hypothetical protein